MALQALLNNEWPNFGLKELFAIALVISIRPLDRDHPRKEDC